MARVNEHAEYVDKHIPLNYKRLFTVLVGSQNYGLSDENSDVDTYSFVIPELEPMMFDNGSSTLFSLGEEYATVYDFRVFGDLKRISSFSFLEVLFSDYVNVTSRGENLYNYLRSLREDIARYDTRRTALSMCGAFKQLGDIIARGDDKSSKKLAQAYRIRLTLSSYCKGFSFERSLNQSFYRTEYFNLKKWKEVDRFVPLYNGLSELVDNIYTFWRNQIGLTNKALEIEIRDKLARIYYNYINLTSH